MPCLRGADVRVSVSNEVGCNGVERLSISGNCSVLHVVGSRDVSAETCGSHEVDEGGGLRGGDLHICVIPRAWNRDDATA